MAVLDYCSLYSVGLVYVVGIIQEKFIYRAASTDSDTLFWCGHNLPCANSVCRRLDHHMHCRVLHMNCFVATVSVGVGKIDFTFDIYIVKKNIITIVSSNKLHCCEILCLVRPAVITYLLNLHTRKWANTGKLWWINTVGIEPFYKVQYEEGW